MEGSFSSGFQIVIQNVTPDIGETYFNVMDKIGFCKICTIEINESLLCDHIVSKEDKHNEEFFYELYGLS